MRGLFGGTLLASDLARARRAAGRGRGKAAVRLAWTAGIHAHARGDQDGLAEVVTLLEAVAGEAPAAVAEEAERARAFCAACLADLRAGKRPQSPLGRLLTGGARPSRRAEKTCPDCAERVLAEALVCRFCGYRFDGAPPAG